MPAKIRLKKVGRKGQPSYRVVVLDGRKPRDAKVVADLGPYDPKTNPPTFEIDGDAALKWLLDGAKPTRAARNILSNAGVLAAWDAAKRGKTVTIEAKELKPDAPKKQPVAEAPAAEEASAPEEPAEVAVAEEAPEAVAEEAVEPAVPEKEAAEA
jgi:small subunit ribosomal protein S16